MQMNPQKSAPLSEGGGPLQRMQEMTAHFSRPGSAYVVQVPEVNRKLEVSQVDSPSSLVCMSDVMMRINLN